MTVAGNLTNSGRLDTHGENIGTASNGLTVTGLFTNNAGGYLNIGGFNDTADVVNVGTLANNGRITIGTEGTLNLTGAANGITDVGIGSEIDLYGSLTAGTSFGLANLGSVEGKLYLENGQTTSMAPGTLSIASTGIFDVERGSNVTVAGGLSNSGIVETNGLNGQIGPNTLTVAGTLTNNPGATVTVGAFNNTADTLNAGAIANSGTVNVDEGATLNLTAASAGSNAGTINLTSSTLKISGTTVTLSGPGTLNLAAASGGANSSIAGANASVSFTNSSTIAGYGTISNLSLVNSGTIAATQSTLAILPGSAGFTNSGTLTVASNATMQIGTAAGGAFTNFAGTTLTGGTYSIGGTLQFGASGASIVTDAANISLTGAGAQLTNFGGQSLLANLAVIGSTGSLTLGSSWGNYTTAGNFTNHGTLSVGTGDKFAVNQKSSLTNFSGSTLSGGVFDIAGILQFRGANIVTNNSNITLTGAGSAIESSGGVNALANFAINGTTGVFTLGTGRSFTTAGNFTNNGLLTINPGDLFDVSGSLTNFSGTTLTGGAYNVSGTLQFNGANIVTNAAGINLGSTSAAIVNQSGTNAMLGFNTNAATGRFGLSGNASLTTTGGSFTNAGQILISTGSTFTVTGSGFDFTQTAGTTTIDGTLASGGSGALNLNGGVLYGTGTVNYGVVDAATVTPGNSATSTGALQVNGTYSQNAAGALDVTIGGTAAGTKYDQLNVSGAAALSGTLNITLAAGYTPAIGNTFDILNASALTGSFATVNGLAIDSSEHFTVATVNGDEIVLTVVSGAAPASASLSAYAGVGHRKLPEVPGNTVGRLLGPIGGSAAHAGVSAPAWRPRDDLGSAPAPLGGTGAAAPGIAGISAAAYNPMASMNHMRFECGVDLGALRKMGGKRLLRGLWASPDSADAVNVGYVSLTTR